MHSYVMAGIWSGNGIENAQKVFLEHRSGLSVLASITAYLSSKGS